MTLEDTGAMTGTGAARRDADARTKGLAATAGVVGAIGASACCILPLALFSVGIGGAWISGLTALEPYQPIFVTATLGFLAAGFWQVYIKPKKACAAGSYCASPTSDRVVKTALWVATILIIVSLTIDLWAPFFY